MAQISYPNTDVSDGTWLASNGAGVLVDMISETVASDTEYIYTNSYGECTVSLTTVLDPSVDTGHIVSYRVLGDGDSKLVVTLKQNTTTIESWTHDPAPATLTTYNQTLTNASAITDYSALRLTFEAAATAFSPTDIPGLIAWWKRGVGLSTASGAVTDWADQVGSYTLSQNSNSAWRPTLQGDNTILFDGSNDYLFTSTFTAISQPFAFVIRYKAVTYGDGNGMIMGNTGGTVTLSLLGTTPEIKQWGGTNVVNANSNLAVNTYGNVFSVYNGTSSSLKVNSTTAVASGTTPGTGTLTNFALGQGGSQPSNIQVSEVMVFGGGSWAGSFSAGDYTNLNAYLDSVGP
jgi:hypothetical protein